MAGAIVGGRLTAEGLHNSRDIIMGNKAQQALVPAGWLRDGRREKIETVSRMGVEELINPAGKGWNPGYQVVPVSTVEEHDFQMGYEIAKYIDTNAGLGNYTNCILPVGPMGQYEHVANFLNRWGTPLDKVTTFNMDEWADDQGNPVVVGETFEQAMGRALFGSLGGRERFREANFATKDNLPLYEQKVQDIIARATAEGKVSKTLLVHGIGQATHIAFVEPHLAEVVGNDVMSWLEVPYLLGFGLCPMTIEQNAFTSSFSDIFGPQPYANTIGPKFYLAADYVIGGCDGGLRQSGNRGVEMSWQAQSLHMTFGWGFDGTRRDIWIPSSMIPQELPGRCFVLSELLEPISALSH